VLVVATAGHVDHGKSALVRALTGMEPDRLDEERRRGLTIELGYAWTTLDGVDGESVEAAFVDVPGHRRFIGTTLAGVGPVTTVLLVVAADAGWAAQTTEHVAAVDALGISRGLVVVSRADLADPEPVAADVARRLDGTSLAGAAVLAVSSRTGAGLDRLRAGLAALATGAGRLPGPSGLWVDRAFTVAGSGTVLTGTLGSGSVSTGDRLVLSTPGGARAVTVRRLESLGRARERVTAPARVAVNLRGLPVSAGLRGSRLTADPVPLATSADVRLDREAAPHRTVRLHVGTAARPVTVRPLTGRLVRLSWTEPLPLVPGDGGLLHDPARHLVVAGLEVLEPDPPALVRRGDARRRGAELLGEPGIRRRAGHLVEDTDWERWRAALRAAAASGPLPTARALALAGVPHADLLPELAAELGLVVRGGFVTAPAAADLALDRLGAAWGESPFRAPSREELEKAGVTPAVLNDAAAAGRVLRLPGGVVLPGDAAERAVHLLAGLPQPFTVSQARQMLGTSRKVAVPLLEHLDRRGLTRRVDATLRTVVPRR
jgi:selenocysteine-specific elongation factor